MPSLLYGSKLWVIKARESIEKVHIQVCKLFLNVPPHTPNDMVYGELGRFPLYIQAAARCLQYWFRIRRQPLCRYSRKAYDLLYGLQERNSKAKTWVYHVKRLLCVKGFGYVWMYGEAGDEKRFLHIFKERLKGCFYQRWWTHISNSERFDLYHCFKSTLQYERDLGCMQSRIHKTSLSRFRLGMSRVICHSMAAYL